MITEVISTFIQLLIFSAIPAVVYLIRKKSLKGFLSYSGFKYTTRKAVYFSVLVSLMFLALGVVLSIFNEEIRNIMMHPPSVTGKFREMGLSAYSVFILLLMAWIKTALAEEIFFRGFIARGLIDLLGYRTGNILQSFIFAAVHVLLFWLLTKAGISFLVFIFFMSGIAAYIIGYIKEKVGNGSILPGWIAHGLGNTISYYVIAFIL